MTPRALGDILWGCAHSGAGNGALFQEVCEQAQVKLRRFSARDVTNFAWGLVRVKYRCVPLQNRMIKLCDARLGEFDAESLALALWSFSQVEGLQGLDRLLRRSTRQLAMQSDHLTGSACANLWGVLASKSFNAPQLFKKLDERTSYWCSTLSIESIASILLALGTLRIENTCMHKLFEEFLQRMVAGKISEKVLPSTLPLFLHAAVTFSASIDALEGNSREALVGGIEATTNKVPLAKALEMSMAALALHLLDSRIFKVFWAKCASAPSLTQGQLTKLRLVHEILVRKAPECAAPETIRKKILDTQEISITSGSTTAEDHARTREVSKDICSLLKAEGLQPVVTVPGIDVALVDKDIAIKIIEEQSFLRTLGQESDGPTSAHKDRRVIGIQALHSEQLKANGWKVFHVDRSLYYNIATIAKREAYLVKLIGLG